MKILATLFVALVGVVLTLVFLLLSSCSQPTPKPTQLDAGASDLFTGKIWNCRLPVVAVERDSAVGDIRDCLLQGPQADPVNNCAVRQATTNYQPVSVACVLRDVGARCNAAWLAGAADPSEKACADAARQWIASHALGYVSIEVSP